MLRIPICARWLLDKRLVVICLFLVSPRLVHYSIDSFWLVVWLVLVGWVSSFGYSKLFLACHCPVVVLFLFSSGTCCFPTVVLLALFVC